MSGEGMERSSGGGGGGGSSSSGSGRPKREKEVHLGMEPEQLHFNLVRDAAGQWQEATTMLYLHNKTETYVAFKVKTTAPSRYLVRPNQALIDKSTPDLRTFAPVEVIIPVKRVREIATACLRAAADPNNEPGMTAEDHLAAYAAEDKFLVQSIKTSEEIAAQAKSQQEAASVALSRIFTEAATNKKRKKEVVNKKLLCTFSMTMAPLDNEAAAAAAAAGGGDGDDDDDNKAAGGGGAGDAAGSKKDGGGEGDGARADGDAAALGDTTLNDTIADNHMSMMSAVDTTAQLDAAAMAGGGGGGGGVTLNAQELAGELMEMRKKYDELLRFFMELTTDKEQLGKAFARAKDELEKLRKLQANQVADRADSPGDGAGGLRRRKGGGKGGAAGEDGTDDDDADGKGKTAAKSGYSIVALLLVAIAMFLLGR